MWEATLRAADVPSMHVKSSLRGGGVDDTGVASAKGHVVFEYDNGWMYCGASGWTKAVAADDYDSDKRLWKIKDHKTKYTKKHNALFHGDTFKLENKNFPGESMYIYEDGHIGCSDYGINDVYKICKKSMMEE